MTPLRRPVPRYVGVLVLLAMAAFAAVGFFTIRRDVDNLRVISQDNTQWSASQMEIELLRFRLSVAALLADPSPATVEEMRERFDILWSRVFMMGHGQVGERLGRYDGGHGPVSALSTYLKAVDPTIAALDPGSPSTPPRLTEMEHSLGNFQQELRQYTLRVMRADAVAAGVVRSRIQASARTTAMISVTAILLIVLSMFLILRENVRQVELAAVSRRSAEQAEQASRAKSRFLTMMSHELRNPLNGILGPLALLGQTDMPARHSRLIGQAQQSGQAMLQLLSGLLDYGEMQDGRFQLKDEAFSLSALADSVRDALRGIASGPVASPAPGPTVRVLANAPERLTGDLDRLRQIFVHLTLYMTENTDPASAELTFGHDGTSLTGEVAVAGRGEALDWKLDLLMGLSEIAPDQVTSEALRPLIARGLIAACNGLLTLVEGTDGRPTLRVTIPAPPVRLEQIRVHLETRSAALAALYQAALRSDRVAFVDPEATGVDVVLVDSTSVGELPLMSRLRARFPSALFVSLGLPQSPDFFDDIVETPNDMSRLRSSILGRLAS